MSFLKNIDDNIWIVDGDSVPWFGFPYTTRMTIVRLNNGNLWIHSPSKIVDGLLEEINNLGTVSYLISPNKIHHLFMGDWIESYPNAQSFSSPGLQKKRSDLNFTDELSNTADSGWAEEIDQLIFTGSAVMEEVVFFHKPSKTLILTDLIENFHPQYFSGWKKLVAKLTGIVSPHGKMPIDWRLTFLFGKRKARRSFSIMLSWQPNKIIIAHGECICENAVGFLERSFNWLGYKK